MRRKPMELVVLNETEQAQLYKLERVIERNITAFYEIGTALLTIRDRRLYREKYKTFESYCQSRWQFAKNYANRLIASAKVVEAVVPTGTIPENEAQARPLSKLPAEEQPEAWKEALETAPPTGITAKHVEAVVDKRIKKEPVTETYSSGLIYVEYAISQMERIHVKDTQRKEAWARMRQWLKDNE
jgi:hypothetical protein